MIRLFGRRGRRVVLQLMMQMYSCFVLATRPEGAVRQRLGLVARFVDESRREALASGWLERKG